jgi:hypothetical protein
VPRRADPRVSATASGSGASEVLLMPAPVLFPG